MGKKSREKREKKHTDLQRGEINDLIALQDELSDLQEKEGTLKHGIFASLIDRYYAMRDKYDKKLPVKRKTYLWLCLLGIIGAHHFYAKHWIKGLLYIAICWTGISIAFGFIDWMIAVPMKPDENGIIMI
ncbi:MAG: NINE protein [Solobacterium sp.]|nr:NINE protein [Solobacterium sp.]